jgi:hypothetical protein
MNEDESGASEEVNDGLGAGEDEEEAGTLIR